ncbi:hypothetical protein CSOJ01_00719 [Colletotrichum sojae]|uniref:XPG-I domain-containing protein n=1 Tax=Colletotrichum sojae TaxID=2175907 RepID=A0A8H6JXE1_9PEZI|nr:hypothetical protein CSOJ01_00719 [Colletotrichum sojae]
MGITKFWPEIAGLGERKSLEQWSKEHLEKHRRPLRIAVDEAHMRYKAPGAQKIKKIKSNAPGAQPIERNIMYRVLRLLKHGILPIFVFDGDERPGNKNRSTGRKSKHGNAGDRLELLKKLLDALHVPRHQARGEAEAECAALQSMGIVDAVWTEDCDAFMFGCSVVVRKTEKSDVVEIFRLERLRERGFTCKEAVVLFAVLVGCDYTKGLSDCGVALARKVLLDPNVQAGDLLEQSWCIETHSERTSWLRRLKDVLPASLKDAVKDNEFASLTTLRNCRRPTVSAPQTLERLRLLAYHGYTAAELQKNIPFLQKHFNHNYASTWLLEKLAPVQLVWSLLKREPWARNLVAASKQKNKKTRLTSSFPVDPLRTFPGIDDSSIKKVFFGANTITTVNLKIPDAILGYVMAGQEDVGRSRSLRSGPQRSVRIPAPIPIVLD